MTKIEKRNIDMFEREDIRSIFKVSDEDIHEWESRGLITPTYKNGKAYYEPSKVACVAAGGRSRKAMKIEYR